MNKIENNNFLSSNKYNFINYGELELENSIYTLNKMSKINSLSYDFFKDKKINLYYSDLNKLDILYGFIKNIFINNIDFYINKMMEDMIGIKYPIFKINKKEIYVTNNSIKIDFEAIYENKIIKIDKNIIINNNVIIENNIPILDLPLLINGEKKYWKHEFSNFEFLYINKYFDYDFDFFKKDIFEIYFENLKYDFSLYGNIPNRINLIKKVVDKKLGIKVNYVSYNFENEIQKFELIYSGDLFLELKNIDLSIKKNNIEFETNIFTLDKVAIDNIMHIGLSIKKAKYSIKIKKNFSKNIANVKLILNNINNNLYFFNEIKDIQKIFEFEINYNFSNISKIDIDDSKKFNLLPVNISPNDINIFLINNVSNINIKSKKILEFNNSKGTILTSIKYSYKNIFGLEIIEEIKHEINNLLSFEIYNENVLINYIKKNFFDSNNFNFFEFKNDFINGSLDWFIKLNNTYINKKIGNLKYKNNILFIDFYIENVNGKILDKCSISLNIKNNTPIIKNTNNNKKIFIIVFSIISILVIALLLSFIYKKIKRKKQIIL